MKRKNDRENNEFTSSKKASPFLGFATARYFKKSLAFMAFTIVSVANAIASQTPSGDMFSDGVIL